MLKRIVKKEAFEVAGIKLEQITSAECPNAWNALYEKASFIPLEMMGNGQSMGLCYGEMKGDKINYMAAYHLNNHTKAEELGLDILALPSAEYFVLTLKGPVPKSIQDGWQYVMEEYFPTYGFEHAGTPDFELYSQGDMTSEHYTMELWVPFVRL